MLEAFGPASNVLPLIWVSHRSMALLTTFSERADVDLAVLPDLSALPVHICIFELASVCLLQICEVVDAFTLKDASDEAAFIVTAIGPLVATMAILLTVSEQSCIL